MVLRITESSILLAGGRTFWGREGLSGARSNPKRRGRVIARVIPDTKKPTLFGNVKQYVMPGSIAFTDDFSAYDGLEHRGYNHKRINHSANVYVMGETHTNTIEGFWSLVKRGIGGVYHNVRAKYLQSYLDKYCFRYNRRHEGNQQFNAILERVCERAS